MGIDYYSCKGCGDSFPDVIEYVWCDSCGNNWCCEECAIDDGYEYGVEIDDDGEEVYTCDNSTCKYCRNEDFEDGYLLDLALTKLGLTRKELLELAKDKLK